MRIFTYAPATPVHMREHKLEIFFAVVTALILAAIFWVNRWAAREGFTPGQAMFGYRRIANEAGLRALNDYLDQRFAVTLPPETRCLNAAEYNVNDQYWLELSLREPATREFLREICGAAEQSPKWTFIVRTTGGSAGSNIRPTWWPDDDGAGSDHWEIRQTSGSLMGGPYSFRFTPAADDRLWVWIYMK